LLKNYLILTYTQRYWCSKHSNTTYYLAYEKINLEDFSDPGNGIYLFRSDITKVDTRNCGNESHTVKIPNTSHPVSKLQMDVYEDTVGITWVSPLESGGYRLSLSKSFSKKPFLTCPDHVDVPDATEIVELVVTALPNTIVTCYTAKYVKDGVEYAMGGEEPLLHHEPEP
jgi:hypothetical protein